MKKVILLILALCLFVSSHLCACASENNPYIGIWVYDRPSGMNSRSLITFQVDDRDRVFYSRQEFFLDGSPAEVESHVYTCEYDSEKLTIKDGDTVIKELFRVSSYKLSSDQRKTYGFYHLALESQEDYDFAIAKESEPEPESIVDRDPVGMWSFYWDAKALNKQLGKNRMTFDINTNNLYLFDNGSAYMTNCSVTNGKAEFSYGALDGLWIGNSDDMTIRVGDQTYKAWIDEQGQLFLKMTDSMAFIYTKIKNYDYKEGTLN